MVKSHERSGDFIESPAFAIAPELLIDEPTGRFDRSIDRSLPDRIVARAWAGWAKSISRGTNDSDAKSRLSFSQSI